MGCIYRAKNCKNNFKIVGQIIFKKEKEKRMTWQLMWRNVRAVALNATFQLLVLYRFFDSNGANDEHDNYLKKKNDVTANMAQRESSSIKRYVSVFSNI